MAQKANKILNDFDKIVKAVWEGEIQEEYDAWLIPEESVLHSSVYFHLRKNLGRLKRYNDRIFVYFKMPFKDSGKNNHHVDIALVILKKRKEEPKELLAAIEIKHYDFHQNSAGLEKDFDNLLALKKGVYYRYAVGGNKLRAKRAYHLYLIEKNDCKLNSSLENKKRALEEAHYCRFFHGGDDISFECIEVTS